MNQAPEPSDLELIARWRAGDEAAASTIVTRHANALARYAVSLGETGEVEELVQDTFVRAFGSIHRFRGDSSLRTWLFTIERRLLLDRRREWRRRQAVVPLDEVDPPAAADPLGEMVASETEARLRAALQRLSPTQREVFSLRVSEGMSYREIAGVAGTTEGAARVHYFNALRTIKEYLDEE